MIATSKQSRQAESQLRWAPLEHAVERTHLCPVIGPLSRCSPTLNVVCACTRFFWCASHGQPLLTVWRAGVSAAAAWAGLVSAGLVRTARPCAQTSVVPMTRDTENPRAATAHPSKSREADVISRASCQKRKVGRKDGTNRPEAMAPNAWHRPTAARPTPDRDADTWTCTRTYVRGGTDRPSMVRGQADAGRRVGRSVVSPQSVSRWCHALACLWHLAHRMMLRTRALFSFSRAYDVTPPWRNSHVMP